MADHPALRTALRAAANGWRVFPVKKGQKAPPLVQWSVEATNDIEKIQRWGSKWKECNWAVACGPSDIWVLDIDSRKGGMDQLDWLSRKHGDLPKTFTVSTPTGGLHFYFKGPGVTSADQIADGIDTRGVGGYVLLPGSKRSEGDYTIMHPFKPKVAPKWLDGVINESVGKKKDRPDVMPDIELDQVANIRRAVQFLKHDAVPAIEGESGDLTTYQTACRAKDYGLTPETCYQLLIEHYNERCEPPWELDDLKYKVDSAYRYGQSKAGSGSAEAVFRNVPLPAHIRPFALTANLIDIDDIKPRAWVLDRRYMRKYLTVTIAPGGVGKSTLALLEAMAILTNKPLTGRHVKRPGNVWVLGEDPQDETERRIAALAKYHQVPRNVLAGLHYSTFRQESMILAGKGPVSHGVMLNRENIQRAIAHIRNNNIVLWVIDPFVMSHDCDENDNAAINKVVNVYHRIAEETGCAISVIHHTRKRGPLGGIGDMDTARGASSLVSAARIAHTLTPMCEDDAAELGVADIDRPFFIRMDNAKANMSAPDEQTEWYRLQSVVLPCGDSVGAMERRYFDDTKIKSEQHRELFDLIVSNVGCGNTMSLGGVIKRLQADPNAPPSVAKINRSTLMRRIENALKVPVDHNSVVVEFYKGNVPGKSGENWIKITPNQLLE